MKLIGKFELHPKGDHWFWWIIVKFVKAKSACRNWQCWRLFASHMQIISYGTIFLTYMIYANYLIREGVKSSLFNHKILLPARLGEILSHLSILPICCFCLIFLSPSIRVLSIYLNKFVNNLENFVNNLVRSVRFHKHNLPLLAEVMDIPDHA